MATLLDYFKADFKGPGVSMDTGFGFEGEKNFTITSSVKVNGESSTKLFTFYIPVHQDTYGIVQDILVDLTPYKNVADQIVQIEAARDDITVGKSLTLYSRRIYFYTEVQLQPEEIARLGGIASEMNFLVTFRSTNYLKRKMDTETYIAFISHDSRDKKLIAEPLAEGLSSRLCRVWYDKYSLEIGANLRESIEKGIKETKKCILILTPYFLKNPGWTKKEFDSIFTREMLFNEKIVLPIWYRVSPKQVYEYSPSLANVVGWHWPSPRNKSEEEYNKEVQEFISKIHVILTSSQEKV